MNNISFKKILIGFGVIFLMSRAKQILGFFSGIFNDEMLSLEPIRDFPDGARAAIAVALCALIFVVIWKLVLKK